MREEPGSAPTAADRSRSFRAADQDRYRIGVIHEALGDIRLLRGEYGPALEHYRALYRTAASDRRERTRAQRKIALVFQHQGTYDRALRILDKAAVGLGTRHPDDRCEKAEIHVQRGRLLKIKGRISPAFREIRKGLAIARRLKASRREKGAGSTAKVRIDGYNNLGKLYDEQGRYPAAIAAYQRSLSISEAIGDKPGSVVTSIGLGMVHFYRGESDRAIACYERAQKTAEAIGDKRGMGQATGNLGIIYATMGDNTRAIACLRKYLGIAEEIGDQQGVARTLGNIGNVYYYQGMGWKAVDNYERALAIYEQAGEKQGIATACTNLGLAYYDLGDFSRATVYYQRSLAICERIGEQQGIATVCSNLGLIHYDQGNYDRSLPLYLRSLRIHRVIGEKQGLSVCLDHMGMTYWAHGDPRRAYAYLIKGLAVAEEISFKNQVAVAKWHMGIVDIDQGRLDRAGSLLNEAREMLEAMDDRRSLADVHLTLARFFEHQDTDLAKAFEHVHQARRLTRTIGSVWGQFDCLAALARLHARRGSFAKARAYLRQALRAYTRLGKKRAIADALFDYGRILLVRSRRKAGQEMVRRAQAAYQDLNLEHMVKKAGLVLLGLPEGAGPRRD